jgi:hypothetical protein
MGPRQRSVAFIWLSTVIIPLRHETNLLGADNKQERCLMVKVKICENLQINCDRAIEGVLNGAEPFIY